MEGLGEAHGLLAVGVGWGAGACGAFTDCAEAEERMVAADMVEATSDTETDAETNKTFI